MNKNLKAWLQLLRPANIITSAADSFAGIVIGASLLPENAHLNLVSGTELALSSALLYGGGVILNDAFDAPVDAKERPERPIPSGIVSRQAAFISGLSLLLAGVGISFMVGASSGGIAAFLALTIVLYDGMAKKNKWTGPFVMGSCRGLNLLLGMSIVPASINSLGYFALFPLFYIAAVTAVSRGEVHGGRKMAQAIAFALYAVVIMGVFTAGLNLKKEGLEQCSMFLAFFSGFVITPLYEAWQDPAPLKIRKAVKRGVIGIVALDACYAVLFTGWFTGCLLLGMMFSAIWVGKKLTVT